MDSSQYQKILENNIQESVTKLKLRCVAGYFNKTTPKALFKIHKPIHEEEKVEACVLE